MTFLEAVPDAPGPAGEYVSVEDFVTNHLSPLIERKLEGQTCGARPGRPTPEAVDRLTAHWLAWEHLNRQGGTGPSTWWLMHADPHLAVLMDADRGPFAQCYKDHTDRCEPLPVTPRAV